MAYVWEREAADPLSAKAFLPPQATTFAEAQDHVNFVVFQPEILPAGCQLTEVLLRPEQPPGRPDEVQASDYGLTPWSEANPCSVRAVISGPGRKLRIKQFLYDWAVPAASTAPLWKSARLVPFRCGPAVGWLGTDYLGNHGACVQRERSQIELSVMQGNFTEGEIQDLLESMVIASPEVAEKVAQVPFHRLNYFVRHRVIGPDVPYGLWEYQQARRYSHSRLVDREALVQEAPVPVPTPAADEYEFDSAVIIENPEENHLEVEVLYRHPANGSDHLWLVAMNQDSEIAFPEQPQAAAHPAEIRRAERLRGRRIHLAALMDEWGAWEALWHERGAAVAVWAGASLQMTTSNFRGLVENLRFLS